MINHLKFISITLEKNIVLKIFFLNHAFDTVMFYLRDSFHFIKTKKKLEKKYYNFKITALKKGFLVQGKLIIRNL